MNFWFYVMFLTIVISVSATCHQHGINILVLYETCMQKHDKNPSTTWYIFTRYKGWLIFPIGISELSFHRNVFNCAFDKLWLDASIERYFGKPLGGATDCLTEQHFTSTIFNTLNGASWHLFAIILLTGLYNLYPKYIIQRFEKEQHQSSKIKETHQETKFTRKKGAKC